MISTPAILVKYKRPRPWALSQEIMWCNEAASDPTAEATTKAATGNKADTVVPYLGFGPPASHPDPGIEDPPLPNSSPPIHLVAVMPQERDHSRPWFRVAV
jgi:hypothetical protein